MKTRPTGAGLAGLVLGYGVIAFGAIGLLQHLPFDKVSRVVLWVAGADLVHDFVLAPLVCIVGVAIADWAPPTLAVAGPRRGDRHRHRPRGRRTPRSEASGTRPRPGNETVLPLDYTTAVVAVLAVLWASHWRPARSRRSEVIAPSRGGGSVRQEIWRTRPAHTDEGSTEHDFIVTIISGDHSGVPDDASTAGPDNSALVVGFVAAARRANLVSQERREVWSAVPGSIAARKAVA